jgi:hypothetical protein
MSPKKYEGFIVTTSSATQLLALVNGFRPWVIRSGQDLLENFIANAAGRDTLDAWILWLSIREKTVDRGMRGPHVDTDFTLHFFPDGERCLGLMRCEHLEWRNKWLEQPGVAEYAYWEDGDRPAHLSEDDWTRRAEDWERVLGPLELIEAGFKIKVSLDGGPVPLGLVSQQSTKRQT